MAESPVPTPAAHFDAPTAVALIGSVSVNPSTVQPGESVLVEVLDGNNKPYPADTPVFVSINGVPSARLYLQFLGVGTHQLQVRAVQGSNSQMATATVTVAGEPLTFRRTLAAPEVKLTAKLKLRQTIGDHYTATFSLGAARLKRTAVATQGTPTAPAPAASAPTASAPTASAPAAPAAAPAAIAEKPPVALVHTGKLTPLPAGAKLAALPPLVTAVEGVLEAQATSYTWDFGDGEKATTQAPTVSHDYFHAIEAGKVSHAFDVTCTVVHDNVVVRRTLVLNSAYGMCKTFGTIVPYVESDVYAKWHKDVGFSASMTVHNVEAAPITLTEMGFALSSDDPDAQLPPPQFTKMTTPIAIQAKSSSAVGVVIPVAKLAGAKLGSKVPGFMVWYKGTCDTGQGQATPVLFSRTVRIPLSESGGAWLTEAGAGPKMAAVNWGNVKEAAFVVAGDPNQKIAVDPSAVVTDEATQTIAIALTSAPRGVAAKAQASAAIRSGLIAATTVTGA